MSKHKSYLYRFVGPQQQQFSSKTLKDVVASRDYFQRKIMLSAAPASVCKNDEGPKEAFNFVPSSNQANKCFGLLSDCV